MGVVKNLMVRAGADFSAISSQAKRASRSMSQMESSVGGSCSRMMAAGSAVNKILGAVGVGISIGAIIAFGKSSKQAYDEQTEASAKLAQVMRNTMGARSDEIASVEDLIDAQERLGVVKGDVQTEGAQELSTYLSLSSSLRTLLPVMNDMVAQQYGMSASAESAVSIATMMGKVMNGQTSALSRYGYSFTAAQEAILKYGTEAQRAATLAAVVSESVGGMNAALAATPNGRLQQVSNTMGKIQESFGQAVSNIAVLFIPAMNVACSILANLATLANKAAQALVNVFGGTAGSASKAVSYTAAAASSVGDLTDQAKAAGKAAKSLSSFGFDNLQILSSPAKKSGGEEAAPGGGAGGITEATEGADAAGESIGWLEQVIGRLKGTMAALNFDNLSNSLSRLKEAVVPLTQEFFAGLAWAYTNIFEPLAKWTVQDLLPAFLGGVATAISVLDAAITAVRPGLGMFVDALKPIVEWVGTKIVDAINSGATVLEGWGKWFSDHEPTFTAIGQLLGEITSKLWEIIEPMADSAWEMLKGALSGIAGIAQDLASNALSWLIEKLTDFSNWVSNNKTTVEVLAIVIGSFAAAWAGVNIAIGIWNAVGALATVVTGGFGAAVAVLTSPITLVIVAIAALIAGIVLLVKNWDTVKAAGAACWDWIKGAWSSAATWFTNTVITPISDGFKGFANGILGFFEGLANGGINAVNSIIGALNGISFAIPDWVPLIGGKSWGFSIPTFSSVSLPRLANGAVFEGNNPYMAIVNDQKHGVNVESPLSTIVEAMMIALRQSDFGGGDIRVDVKAVFEGQLAALARLMQPYFKAEVTRLGNRASRATEVG